MEKAVEDTAFINVAAMCSGIIILCWRLNDKEISQGGLGHN